MRQLELDLQFFAGEKTEKATPRKRRDERRKGRVAKSQDVNTALLLLFSFLMIGFYSSWMKGEMTDLYTSSFTKWIHFDLTTSTVSILLLEALLSLLKIVAPIMLVAFIASIAANLIQVGFLFTTEPLKFDLKRLDPIQGAKRIFSLRALIELLKSFLKIIFVGTVTFSIIWIYREDMMELALKNTDQAIQFFGKTTWMMGIIATIALIILAIFDYAYQRYDFEKNMRMSKQEVKDEYKDIEGDPLIRSKIKERQRQMAMRRMMSEIPKADVIITNPTHYSVAVKYDENIAIAPYVVAKGVDEIALKIREIGKAHNIMILENKELARSLYDGVEIGEVIPEKFYQAVAEVLAYVYRLENKA